MSVFFIMSLVVLQGNVMAQKTCAFFGAGAPPEGHVRDSLLIAHLGETFELTIFDDDTLLAGLVTREVLEQFDFGFVSESASTFRLRGGMGVFKTVPIPMFYTENFAADRRITGWVSAEGFFGTSREDLIEKLQQALSELKKPKNTEGSPM